MHRQVRLQAQLLAGFDVFAFEVTTVSHHVGALDFQFSRGRLRHAPAFLPSRAVGSPCWEVIFIHRRPVAGFRIHLCLMTNNLDNGINCSDGFGEALRI